MVENDAAKKQRNYKLVEGSVWQSLFDKARNLFIGKVSRAIETDRCCLQVINAIFSKSV